MAEVSPAMYLLKRSRSALMVLMVTESTCDHQHIQVKDELTLGPRPPPLR